MTKFKCLRCGKCCRTMEIQVNPLKKETLKKLAKEMKIPFNPGKDFIKPPCPFYRERSCLVYLQRPEICRTFPIVIGKVGTGILKCKGISICPGCTWVLKNLPKEEYFIEKTKEPQNISIAEFVKIIAIFEDQALETNLIEWIEEGYPMMPRPRGALEI